MGAFQSQHWYTATGEPAYGATLRDARKSNLVPSVTTIERVIAAPQLVRWQVEQALDAALTLPRLDGESLDAFKDRALEDSRRQAIDAADAGSRLHDALERGVFGKPYPAEYAAHVEAAGKALFDLTQFDRPAGYHGRWEAEVSFAHPLGFGGKVDLYAKSIGARPVVCDWKSKPRIEDGKKYAYDNHARQLAAYAVGLGVVTEPDSEDAWKESVILANGFVGIECARVSIHRWTPAVAFKGWKQFRAALALWQTLNNFDSSF